LWPLKKNSPSKNFLAHTHVLLILISNTVGRETKKYTEIISAFYAKTFRKTWESWLLFSFPDKAMEIALSQGHTELTQLRHYANLPFLDKDREEMKEFVVGWA